MDTNKTTDTIFENASAEEIKAEEVKSEEAKAEKSTEFRFFKCCSASLKRFSIIMFVINAFLAVALTGVATVLLGVYVGISMLSLLALPIITFFVILLVVARFISALIYGFAEIVEKNEK